MKPKFHSFAQACCKCGKPLDRAMKLFLFDNNFPGACSEHLQEVLEEADKNIGTWPSDWHGGSWRDNDRTWRFDDEK